MKGRHQRAAMTPDRHCRADTTRAGLWFHWRLIASVAWLVLVGTIARGAPDDPSAVFVMRLDGSQLRRIGQVEGYQKHGSPRWSHDGKRVLFDASEGPNGAWKVFVVNFDGTGLSEVGQHGFADWSPDDKQLTSYSYVAPGQNDGVWTQNVDGKGREFLGPGTGPRWSPDGAEIAMADGGALFILNLIDGQRRSLLDHAGLWHLANLQQLEWLDLSGTKVTEGGIDALERSLPNCKIHLWLNAKRP